MSFDRPCTLWECDSVRSFFLFPWNRKCAVVRRWCVYVCKYASNNATIFSAHPSVMFIRLFVFSLSSLSKRVRYAKLCAPVRRVCFFLLVCECSSFQIRCYYLAALGLCVCGILKLLDDGMLWRAVFTESQFCLSILVAHLLSVASVVWFFFLIFAIQPIHLENSGRSASLSLSHSLSILTRRRQGRIPNFHF